MKENKTGRIEFRSSEKDEKTIELILEQCPELTTRSGVIRAGIYALLRELEVKKQCRFSQLIAAGLNGKEMDCIAKKLNGGARGK